MLWIVALTFFVLRKLALKIDDKVGSRNKQAGRWVHLLPFLCLVMMVWALAYAPLPFGLGSIAGLLASLLNWVLGFVGGWFGVSGGAVAAVALLAVVALGLWDLAVDGKPDGIAKTAVYTIPVLALVASGPIAPVLLDLVHTINSSTPSLVASITGG